MSKIFFANSGIGTAIRTDAVDDEMKAWMKYLLEHYADASLSYNQLPSVMPDEETMQLGLTEAQAYAVVWKTFQEIQQAAPRAVVFYGQETGVKKENPEKPFDELGVLLPIHEFEKKMLQHMEEIDGIVLACRERMMELAGNDSLKL